MPRGPGRAGGPGDRAHPGDPGGAGGQAPLRRGGPRRRPGRHAPHHGLQGLHQGWLEERSRGAAGADGQGTERGGAVLPPRETRKGEIVKI